MHVFLKSESEGRETWHSLWVEQTICILDYHCDIEKNYLHPGSESFLDSAGENMDRKSLSIPVPHLGWLIFLQELAFLYFKKPFPQGF